MADAIDYPAELRRIATNVLLDGEDRDMRILDEAAAELERLTPKTYSMPEIQKILNREKHRKTDSVADAAKEWLLRAAEMEDACGGVLACGGAFVDGVAEVASAECPDGAEVVDNLKSLIGYSMSHDNIGLDAITSAIRLIRIWDARLKSQAAENARLAAELERLTTPAVEPDPCPDCEGLAAVAEDVKTHTFAVGCRQAFFRRDEADAECKDHPSIVLAGTRNQAVAAWNSWAAGRRVFLA